MFKWVALTWHWNGCMQNTHWWKDRLIRKCPNDRCGDNLFKCLFIIGPYPNLVYHIVLMENWGPLHNINTLQLRCGINLAFEMNYRFTFEVNGCFAKHSAPLPASVSPYVWAAQWPAKYVFFLHFVKKSVSLSAQIIQISLYFHFIILMKKQENVLVAHPWCARTRSQDLGWKFYPNTFLLFPIIRQRQ